MGIGNLARIKAAARHAVAGDHRILTGLQDMVAAEVTRAVARLQSATARVSQADRALRTAIITFNGNYEGSEAHDPFRRRLGPGQPAAGSGLRPPALEAGPGRLLHHGRRIQPGTVRAVPRAGLPGPRDHVRAGPPARSSRWTRHGPTICLRWATGRRRQPAKAISTSITHWCHKPFRSSQKPRLAHTLAGSSGASRLAQSF